MPRPCQPSTSPHSTSTLAAHLHSPSPKPLLPHTARHTSHRALLDSKRLLRANRECHSTMATSRQPNPIQSNFTPTQASLSYENLSEPTYRARFRVKGLPQANAFVLCRVVSAGPSSIRTSLRWAPRNHFRRHGITFRQQRRARRRGGAPQVPRSTEDRTKSDRRTFRPGQLLFFS